MKVFWTFDRISWIKIKEIRICVCTKFVWHKSIFVRYERQKRGNFGNKRNGVFTSTWADVYWISTVRQTTTNQMNINQLSALLPISKTPINITSHQPPIKNLISYLLISIFVKKKLCIIVLCFKTTVNQKNINQRSTLRPISKTPININSYQSTSKLQNFL